MCDALVASVCVLSEIAVQSRAEASINDVRYNNLGQSKEVVGHITPWEEVALRPLRRYADGDPFGNDVIEDYLAWNDEQAALKRDIPLMPSWTKRPPSARSWSRRSTGCRRSSGSKK
jgi:hypothetical protein